MMAHAFSSYKLKGKDSTKLKTFAEQKTNYEQLGKITPIRIASFFSIFIFRRFIIDKAYCRLTTEVTPPFFKDLTYKPPPVIIIFEHSRYSSMFIIGSLVLFDNSTNS